jgi:hypothetical protein
MHVRQPPDLQRLKASVERVGRLSDGLFRLGPISIGLDGILSWIPGAGELYGLAAAVFILVQGARARVPAHILLTCAAMMGGRTVISAIPWVGPAIADLITTHKWSARMIARAIDRPGASPNTIRLGVNTGRAEGRADHRLVTRWTAVEPLSD